jgi:hypothetical protein
VIRRIAGVVVRPRATLEELAARPAWVATWIFILITWAVCGGALLASDMGEPAAIDERVRVIETFGGSVSDADYRALLARPPYWVYLTSGGRLLLTPIVTLLSAVGVWLTARADGARATLSQGLAIAVHASLVLLLGQLVATPLHYMRESLTSPLNLTAVLPFMEEGTFRTRLFGTIDLFAVWWAVLIALGLAVLTGKRPGRYLVALAGLFMGFGAVVAAAIAAFGGS